MARTTTDDDEDGEEPRWSKPRPRKALPGPADKKDRPKSQRHRSQRPTPQGRLGLKQAGRPPDTVTAVLRNDADGAKLCRQHFFEGNAPLHHDLQYALGDQMCRGVTDEALQQRMILHELLMQRRVGKDGAVARLSRASARSRASNRRPVGTFSRAASKATLSLSVRSRVMVGSCASAAAPITPEPHP